MVVGRAPQVLHASQVRIGPIVRQGGITRYLLLSLATLCLTCGCVRRRLTVRTNPPGARVYVDKQFIGTSPTTTSYTYYGTREIEVVSDGFRTERVFRQFSPPWYELPPLDFISETLWPWELRDERIVDVTMVPSQPPASDALLAEADGMRLRAVQGLATALPPPATASPDFRNQTVLPGNGYPTRPIDPTLVPGGEPAVTAPQQPGSTWRPGQLLQNIFRPGGQPPQSIPETGILSGGGYRPSLDP